jgi:hypothetical protein
MKNGKRKLYALSIFRIFNQFRLKKVVENWKTDSDSEVGACAAVYTIPTLLKLGTADSERFNMSEMENILMKKCSW